MPQTYPHLTDHEGERPRVGLFLVPAHRRTEPLTEPGSWHGLDPQHLAWLICHYTRDGDVVLDLDNHPTFATIARYLHRRRATITGDHVQICDDGPAHTSRRAEDGVAILLAGLPRPDDTDLDLRAATEAMRRWHRLLRPGGFLLTALPAAAIRPGRAPLRSTVITAARAAGLRFHQHLPLLLVPLPEADSRTHAATAASTPPALIDGRHLRARMDVLAFTATTLDLQGRRCLNPPPPRCLPTWQLSMSAGCSTCSPTVATADMRARGLTL